jgi:predicted metalloprotease with PDZ domain
MTNTLRYTIVSYDLDAHEFVVMLELPSSTSSETKIHLPAWIPGSYMIRDFARNITELSVSAKDRRVPVRKLGKQTWSIAPTPAPLEIRYRVYAFDLSVRAAYLDSSRAFFNGTSLFFRVEGQEDASWEVRMPRPDAAAASDWRVATAWEAIDVDRDGFGRYRGSGYAELIDSPVEIGRFEDAEFEVGGRPHRVVVSDGGRFDMGRLCRDLSKICAQHAAMFDGLPVDSYCFLTLATVDGYGGLEHRNSTSLICKRSDLPRFDLGDADPGYRRFLGLCSHEYFHLWNVKRIRPAVLAAADLSTEAHTELLWAFEGITSYYDELALARSQVISTENYLAMLAESVTRVLRNPGRGRQSIAESSFDAWTKFYKQDENAANAIVSYYTKGACVALGLDLTIRRLTDDRFSLDDLMRHLWQTFGKHAVGLPERSIERELRALTGRDFAEFFERYVYGVDEPPWADWFASLGVGFRTRPGRGPEDLGGYAEEEAWSPPAPVLGARYQAESAGIKLTTVVSGGAAQQAGLSPGDMLIAIDGVQVAADNLADLLSRSADPVVVHYFRRGLLQQTTMRLRDAEPDTCELWLLPADATSAQVLARRERWLASASAQA